MAVRTALVVALQLLLKMWLHADAQVLGECRVRPIFANDSGDQAGCQR